MPYNPGVTDRSGELFASGLAPGMAALARGVEERTAQAKRTLQNGKIADSFAKTNPEVYQLLGMTPDEFHAQSAEEKSAAVTGMMQGLGAKQMLAHLQALGQEYDVRQQGLEQSRQEFPDRLNLLAGQAKGTELKNAELERQTAAQQKFNQAQGTYEALPKTIRNPDWRGVLGQNIAGSGLSAEDAMRQQEIYEQLHSNPPGTMTPIAGAPGLGFVTQGRRGEGSPMYIPGAQGDGPVNLRETNVKGVWLDPKGKTVKAPRPEKAAAAEAPAEEWIVGDDVDLFKRKLKGIDDPATRDAILRTRARFNTAIGRVDPVTQQLLEMLKPGGGGAAAGKTPAAGSTASRVRKYNPATGKIE
jgi:hypothetical protein